MGDDERIQPGPFSRSLGFELTQDGRLIAKAATSHARLDLA